MLLMWISVPTMLYKQGEFCKTTHGWYDVNANTWERCSAKKCNVYVYLRNHECLNVRVSVCINVCINVCFNVSQNVSFNLSCNVSFMYVVMYLLKCTI